MTITPVLLVDAIEPSLPFWVDRLGFQKISEVPEGNRLAFAMLTHNGTMLMLQTFASAQGDVPQFPHEPGKARASLYLDVDDWDDMVKRLNGYPITMPERQTFYGMREIGVLEPNGHIVIFAHPLPKS